MDNVFWLFPIIFMIHEMEEIIGFKLWLEKNNEIVKKNNLLKKLYKNFSTEGFAIAILEEYLLCILLTTISIIWKAYLLWIGVFIAFTVHLAIHIIQSIVISKYIPALISSVVLLPISIFLIVKTINYFKYDYLHVIVFSTLSIILMVLNLIFVHWIMEQVTKKIKEL
ncbi:HXXEE domain-containing protein [Streptococcus zalophi]|uniref:HXXEE domain-containing protein n=1 Tax=Streptococcus zalophi TaxID=640031 RepID=A0A934P8R1_9STRE|nr:HXXEE domain-containing protein [Streptococcus zalophi]MBJ8349196.1 HXXEE domain-containing protein [Streptococcus zalophi]MCR8967181.1 HXXEE domain-containing protein [Streptococcus zalophi]